MNNAISTTLPSSLGRDSQAIIGLLQQLRHGSVDLRLPDGAVMRCGDGDGPAVALFVDEEEMFSRVLARGDIGFAEAYLDGQWRCNDLTALFTLLARNRETLREAVHGRWLNLLATRLGHWLWRRNSRRGSRRNIMAHYDLGNDFYRLWLDEGMNYSAALFSDGAATLAEAQAAKQQRIFDRLQAQPGQRLLEIGCGWGDFAAAARQRGLDVTGLTLSPAQLHQAQQRAAGADLRLQDYRDLEQRFDHIVSVEMFEAVGERWWPTFFGQINKCLAADGVALIQSIVIRDDLFASYRKHPDFIQQFIFPGGMLPSPAQFQHHAAAAGLVVSDAFAFGGDYARTLASWRESFDANWPRIAALGFDETFRRLWRLYLGYCEAGFIAGDIDVVQYELRHRS